MSFFVRGTNKSERTQDFDTAATALSAKFALV